MKLLASVRPKFRKAEARRVHALAKIAGVFPVFQRERRSARRFDPLARDRQQRSGARELGRGGRAHHQRAPAFAHRELHLHHLLGFPAPTYAHVPLVLGPDGTRLAKRHGAVTLAQLAACDAADVDLAVARAKDAFDDGRWRKLAPAGRKETLLRLARPLGQWQCPVCQRSSCR